MELTREQVKAKLRALAGADNTPWDAPTLTHMDLLAHDQALRESRDELAKELQHWKEAHRNIENAVLKQRVASLEGALRDAIDDFEMDYVLDGEIVDNPPKGFISAYQTLKHALEGKP